MLLFDIGKVCRTKIFTKKINISKKQTRDYKGLQGIMLTEIPRSSIFVTLRHTTPVIFTVKICIFERSNEKNNFSKTKIYFHKKTAPQL